MSAPAPWAALSMRAKRWLGAVLCSSCPLAYFQVFQAAAVEFFQVLILWISFSAASRSSAFLQLGRLHKGRAGTAR